MEEITFIDRKEELTLLKKALERKGAELIIVYGRRRVGKSRMLDELKKIHDVDISVMMEESDYQMNLRKFSSIVAKKYHFPSFSPNSFREVFENLPDKSIIIIDEFSYISDYAGEFQGIWEEIIKKKQQKLILCGSFIRIMEDLTYSIKSPLYGRATEVLKLMPLKFQHVYEWYSKKKIEDVLNVYFCVGGIPRYLEIISTPNIESIKNSFLSKNSLLLREGKLLLKENFPSSVLFPRILFVVADKKTVATEIANAVNLSPNQISKYLSILCDYGYIEKRFPIIGGTKKDTRFYLSDKFFSFWSLFIWPYYSDLENGDMQGALYNLGKKYNSYCGMEFERLILEILPLITKISSLHLSRIGNQWGRLPATDLKKSTYEIDILGVNDLSKLILFGECKWQDNVDAKKILKELKEKAKYVDWNNEKRKEKYAIFAKSFKEKIISKYLLLFDLKDIELIISK